MASRSPGDQVVRDTVEEGVLAEQVGIDSFNIGEHLIATT